MRKVISVLTVVLLLGAMFVSCRSKKSSSDNKRSSDTLSYIVGMNIGHTIMEMDSTLNIDVVCDAIRDVYKGKEKMTMEDARDHYLAEKVYVSLDIDALKIEFCTHTNSPVPGGMTFDEVVYLVNCVVKSGREIVGFDITEVVSNIDDKMDAIVAVRLLTKMIVATLNKSK